MVDYIPRSTKLGHGTPLVCRLGLATRGNSHLSAEDVRLAMDRGINYLNWCRHHDGMSQAISELAARDRERVVLAFQFYARSARAGERELSKALSLLRTDYIDIVTFYYVESSREWEEIAGSGGAMEYLQKAKQEGKVRLVGLTTHQRRLAAQWVQSGLLDLLMVRYNAAHCGAEEDVFPITRRLGIPVVVFTCLRWGALLQGTPEDPPGFEPPDAPTWYRFVLANPDVSVALTAPGDHQELLRNLSILESWESFDQKVMSELRQHGDRVHKHAGSFP